MSDFNLNDFVDLLQAVDVGLWQVDLRSGAIWWSERTRAIHEVGADFVPSLESAIAFYAPEAQPSIREAVRCGIEEGKAWDLKLPFVTARGRRLWVRACGRACRTPDGPPRLIGTFEDMTEQRHRAEEHQRLARVVQQTSNGVVITDAARRIEWVNRAFEKMTGYSLPDLLGRSPGALLQGRETDPATVARMRNALRTGKGFHVEVLNYHASGRPYWVEIRCSPMRDADGQLKGFIAIENDVTARKRAEEMAQAELRQRQKTETLLRDILDALPNAVAAFDSEKRLLLANPAFAEFYPHLAEVARPGSRLEDLIRHEIKCGSLAPQLAAQIAPDAPEAEREAWLDSVIHTLCSGAFCGEMLLPEGRWVQAAETRSASGNLVCVRTDITRIKTMEAEAQRRARVDELTGLANRAEFFARIAAIIEGRRESDAKSGSLILFDIDHFKAVNDALGHPAGDALLRAMADRLGGILRAGDSAARLGGDEFAIILPGLTRPPAIETFLQRLTEALQAPLQIGAQQLRPSLSLGLARFPEDAPTAETLMMYADTALYEAKRQGRGRWCFFDASLAAELVKRARVFARLPTAIAEGQIDVALQPKQRLSDGSHAGFEALARWQDGDEAIPPAVFVPIAEESGVSVALGDAVFTAAFRALRALLAAGLSPGRMAVNVSTQQLLLPNAARLMLDGLARHGLHPRQLEIEINETVLLDRSSKLIGDTLAALRAAGVGIALDDFGTGYASLAHLTRFPITCLKIDRRFVAALGTDSAEALVAQSVIGLAHGLGVETVAEGVETETQRVMLRELGCDIAQGWLIARPLTPAAARRHIARLAPCRPRAGKVLGLEQHPGR
jgi:diguanylate cyclase (GGDEF)-like protein/PAS domain S-box-containing protein